MSSARPSATQDSAHGTAIVRGPVSTLNRSPADTRESQGNFQSIQPQSTARNDINAPKRSGFGFFGKAKDDDDERDQLKRYKAENKLLRAQLRDLEDKSTELAAENEKFKSARIGDRKINNQLHPDSYYSSLLERLSVGITDWTVTHFRGKNGREYTHEMIDEIRAGLRKLSDANNLIPEALLWVNVDLQSALTDSKFRIAFVLHIIGLHLHEKIYSPFSYEVEDFGLGYWLKRISDEVSRSGYINRYRLADILAATDVYFKWEWSKTLFRAVPGMFDGTAVGSRIFRHLRRILRPIHPKETPDDAIFEKLQEYINQAIEIAVSMRLEQARFVSTFPIRGAAFQNLRHSTGGEEQTGLIRMCTFPGVVKQTNFLGASPADMSIFKARVHLQSTFQYLGMDPEVSDNDPADTGK
jgi:hypothetical protein